MIAASSLLVLATLIQAPPAPVPGAPNAGESPAKTREPAAGTTLQRPTFDSKGHVATDAERAEIAACIERLALVDAPDVGMSSTMSSAGFLPIPDMREVTGGLLSVNHGVKPSTDLAKLVAFGPKAIPALLAVLDDATPTRFRFDRSSDVWGGMGSAWFGHEVPVNTNSERESAAVREFPTVFQDESSSSRMENSVSSYTLTRGDVAFVALGQILNRNYQAMRYQPTACQVINSPVHDPRMAAALRKMWSSDDPARMLYESLWNDLTGARSIGASRTGALVRLLYDYPGVMAPLVADRLDRLIVSDEAVVANGGRVEAGGIENFAAVDWCGSVSWCEEPLVVDALARVVERTDSASVVTACVRAPLARVHGDVIVKSCERLVARAPLGNDPRDAVWGSGDWRAGVLVTLLRYLPDRAEPACRAWFAHEHPGCRFDVVNAAMRATAPVPWLIPLLRPMLAEKASTSSEYGPDYDRRATRVCDHVAVALARHVPGATFELEGTHEELDRQIEVLDQRIDGVVVEKPVVVRPRIEELTAVKPSLDFEVKADIGEVLAISDEGTLFVTSGYHDDGWVLDVVEVNAKTGTMGKRTRIETWRGGVTTVRPSPPDRIVAYRGDEQGEARGELVVRDARTGVATFRRASGFHSGVGFGDPEQVRGLGDLVGSSDGRYVFAWTCDSMLHTLDMTSDVRLEVATPRSPTALPPRFDMGQLTSVEGTHFVLVSASGELSIWNADARTLTKLERMPTSGWHSAWGRYACNSMNGDFQVFDLETGARIPVRYPPGARVQDVRGDAEGKRMFAYDASGSIFVVDLPSAGVIAVLEAPAAKPYASLTLSTDRKRLYRCEALDERDPKTNTRSDPRTRILAFDVSAFTR